MLSETCELCVVGYLKNLLADFKKKTKKKLEGLVMGQRPSDKIQI